MNYNVFVADEAIVDIIDLVKYVRVDLHNPDAAENLYHNLKREVENVGDFPVKFSDAGFRYRGYVIHKKVYKSYLVFYVINDKNREVYVLRVIKDLMNWQKILSKTKIYHLHLKKI